MYEYILFYQIIMRKAKIIFFYDSNLWEFSRLLEIDIFMKENLTQDRLLEWRQEYDR